MERLIFGTDGWRDVIAERFTFANLRRAARAYADYLAGAGGAGPVLVGYDTRFMAREFAEVVSGVLAAAGLPTMLSQTYLPTPALSFAVRHLGAVGGVMLTASHNPPHYGGFKLKGPYGGSATDDIYRAVAALVPDAEVPRHELVAYDTFDIRAEYFSAIATLVDIDAIRSSRPTIVHDAMGGAGSGWLSGLAAATGAFEVESVRGRPDPLFYGVNPEPIAANLAHTIEKMAGSGTDPGSPLFASATDGDADRIGVVLPGGEFFNSHQIFAVLLDHLAARRTGTVVKTFTVSRVVERLARARGLPVVETPVGFNHIVDAMLVGGDVGVLIGGEESGGIGVAGHIPERDAIANTLLLLEAVVTSGRSLAQRFADIESETGWRHAYDRVDLHLADDGTKERVMARLASPDLADLGALSGRWHLAAVESRDGVKLNLARTAGAEPSAWLLFRPSGTEPVLRLYCEAQNVDDVAALLSGAEAFVRSS